ncbi:MAG: hypothetical protein WBQ61_22070 [Candidatus Acidiferrum sp.]
MEHLLRRPVESRQAYAQKRKVLAWGIVSALIIAAVLTFLLVG